MNQFAESELAPVIDAMALESFEEEYMAFSLELVDCSFVTMEANIIDKIKEIMSAIKKWIKSFFSNARATRQKKVLKASSEKLVQSRDAYREFFSNSGDWLISSDGIPNRLYLLLLMVNNGSFQFVMDYVVNTVSDVSGDIASVVLHRDSLNELKHAVIIDGDKLIAGRLQADKVYDDLKFVLDNQTQIIDKCHILLDAATGLIDDVAHARPDEHKDLTIRYASALVSLAKDVLVVTASNTKDIELFFKRVDAKMRQIGIDK